MTDKNLNINLLNTKEDVSSGMHVPSGDAQYISPSATMEAESEDGYVEDVSMKKKALNMLDIPSAGVPENPGLSREQGADEETNLYGAKSDSFDSPSINDKYKSQNNNKNYGNNSNSVEESYFTYLYDLDHDSNIGILDDLKNTFYYSKEASKMSKNIDKRISKALGLLKSADAQMSHVPSYPPDAPAKTFSTNDIVNALVENVKRGSGTGYELYNKYLLLFPNHASPDSSDFLSRLSSFRDACMVVVTDNLKVDHESKIFVANRQTGRALEAGQRSGDEVISAIRSEFDKSIARDAKAPASPETTMGGAAQAPMASISPGTDEWAKYYPDASLREQLKAAWAAYPASKKVSESGLEYGSQQAPDSFWGFVQWYKHEKAANGGKDFSPAVAIHKLKAETTEAPTQTAKLTDPNSVPESMKAYTEPKHLENAAPQTPAEQGPMMPQASATKSELNKLAKVLTNKKAKDAVIALIKKADGGDYNSRYNDRQHAMQATSDVGVTLKQYIVEIVKKDIDTLYSYYNAIAKAGKIPGRTPGEAGFITLCENYLYNDLEYSKDLTIYSSAPDSKVKDDRKLINNLIQTYIHNFASPQSAAVNQTQSQNPQAPQADISPAQHHTATHAATNWDEYVEKTPNGGQAVKDAWMKFIASPKNDHGYTDDYKSFVAWYMTKKTAGGEHYNPAQAVQFLTSGLENSAAPQAPATATPAATPETPAADKDGKPEGAKEQVSGMEAVKAVTVNTINSLYKMSGSDKNYFRMLDKKRVGSAQATKQRLDWLFRSAGFNYDKLADAVIKRMPGTAQITQADVMDNKWTGFVAMEFVDAIKSLVQEIRSKKQQKANAANAADDGKGGKSSRASLERMAKLIKLT